VISTRDKEIAEEIKENRGTNNKQVERNRKNNNNPSHQSKLSKN